METIKNIQQNADQQDKQNYKSKELIKREEIKDSPFTIITIKGESFGVMGEYRLTEPKKSKKEVKKELEKITWNRLIQVVMILNEIKTKNLK